MHPLDKNGLRTEQGLRSSLDTLDALWREARSSLLGVGEHADD